MNSMSYHKIQEGSLSYHKTQEGSLSYHKIQEGSSNYHMTRERSSSYHQVQLISITRSPRARSGELFLKSGGTSRIIKEADLGILNSAIFKPPPLCRISVCILGLFVFIYQLYP